MKTISCVHIYFIVHSRYYHVSKIQPYSIEIHHVPKYTSQFTQDKSSIQTKFTILPAQYNGLRNQNNNIQTILLSQTG